MDENIGLVITDGEKSYKILEPVGIWGPQMNLIVYDAAVLGADDDLDKAPHFALKMIPEMGDLQEYHDMTLEDLHKSRKLADDVIARGYILPVTNSFYSEIRGKLTLCIVFPCKADVISLRSIMSTGPRFADGIPEAFIKIALVRVVRGLQQIHNRIYNEKRMHHMQLTTNAIVFNHVSETVQLSYAATVYESGAILNDNNVYSMNKMLAWGLAPEVKGVDEPFGYVHAYDTAKSDIWLVGIAALELAYGKLPVESRKELLQVARYICQVKVLPDTWEDLKLKSAELAADKDLPIKKRKLSNEEAITASLANVAKGRFSDCFAKFLAFCLDADLNRRASAMQLGKHAFLQEGVGSMINFRDIVVKGLSPHVLRVLGPKKPRC